MQTRRKKTSSRRSQSPKGDKAQASAEPRRSGGATACGQGNAAAAARFEKEVAVALMKELELKNPMACRG